MSQSSTLQREPLRSARNLPGGLAGAVVSQGAGRDLLALAFLLGLAVVVQARQIFLGGTFNNQDILLQSIPVYSWYSESLRQGALPIWSPAILGGFPLAFSQYGFFYPPDMLLFWLLDASRAFHLSLALHLALAGWATYWYCRVLGLRRLPSLFAAVAFQMGNQPLAWPANGFITKTLFVLPALLACVELMYRRDVRYWLLIPPVVGAGLLVGYAQFVFIGLLVAGAYLLVLIAVNRRSLTVQRSAGLLALFGSGALIGTGLAAIRVLPTMAVTALSVRANGLSFGQSAVESIHPIGLLLGNLLPEVYELPFELGGRPDYIGPPALLLAFLAIGTIRSLGYIGWFHAALALAATLLSLGSFTPFYGFFFNLPFLSYFRVPGRFSLVVALALAILAGLALDRYLVRGLSKRTLRYRVVAIAGGLGALATSAGLVLSLSLQFGKDPLSDGIRPLLLEGQWDLLNLLRPRVALPMVAGVATPWLLLAAARGRIPVRRLEWSLLGISASTLLAVGGLQSAWLPPDAANQRPEFLEAMAGEADLFRAFAWGPGVETFNTARYFTEVLETDPGPDFEERFSRQLIPPNTGLLYGVSVADGYEVLQSRRQALFALYLGSERQDPAKFSDGSSVDRGIHERNIRDRINLLATFNVKYVTVGSPVDDARLEQLAQAAVIVYPWADVSDTVHLYRIRDSLPRAFVVPESVTVGEEARALEMVAAAAVDPRQVVILEETPPRLYGSPLTPQQSSVSVEEYWNERVVLRARTDGAGFLVLMDFLLPGWSATVDGLPVQVMAGNFAGRAVPILGAGEHEVVFEYKAPLFREGLAVSLASLAVLMLFGVGSKMRVTSRAGQP